MRLSLAFLSGAALACGAVAGCAEAATDTATGGSGGAAASTTSSTTTTATTTGAGGSGGDFIDPGSSGGGYPGDPIIYAHTDTSLFQIDPTSPDLDLKLIGDFDCVGGAGQDPSMTDFAVDESLQLWGISWTAVHPLTIDGGVVHCEAPIALDSSADVKFYGLTFAPAGLLDPTKEVLVGGNTAGELWAIDAQGALKQHGTFGKVPANDGHGHTFPNAGKAWELSGDIVFLANGGSPVGYATVRDCPNPPSSSGCNAINTLLEIDVGALASATTQSVTKKVLGQIVTREGCNDGLAGDYGSMYGIAAWDAKVYGLSRSGNLVDIDLSDGTGCLARNYPASKFAGAGVTTIAPIQPPPG